MLTILKNAWYAAAYSDEVGEQPLARTLVGEKFVLFRQADGGPAILPDRCPHRFAPLSEGRVVEDAIECPYHGLRFDGAGHCVFNPHTPAKGPLRAANVRALPVMERYGIVWFWPGDPNRADPDELPQIAFLERPEEYAVVHGFLHVRGHYELVVDNLLDLSHAAYLHPQFFDAQYSVQDLYAATEHRLERHKRSLVNHRIRSGLGPPSACIEVFGMDEHKPVHTDSTMTWYAPAMLDLAAGSWEMGKERETGVHLPQLHIITPETEFTSHYFFISGRNRRRDDPAIDRAMLEFFNLAFSQQDEPMIEMVQSNMGPVSDINELGPILLPIDAAPVTARRILASLIAEEEGGAQAIAAAG